MKSAGIIRNVDELGRIVVPKEMRRALGIANGEPVEIFAETDRIILMKYEPSCVFCGSSSDVILYKGKKICTSCLAELHSMLK